MSKSFRAALAEYAASPYPDGTLPNLTKADSAHLKRWTDDDRTDEIWKSIISAPKVARIMDGLPDGSIEWWFIQEVLGQRRLAEHIYYLRKQRNLHLKSAAQLQQAANILREKAPDGIQRHELAQELEGVAKQYKTFSAASFDNPRVVKWNRLSKPFGIFISSLSNILKDLSGRWLDYEVAVLAQIAFDDPDIDKDQVTWIRRKVERYQSYSEGG